jgi:hypothetical protein
MSEYNTPSEVELTNEHTRFLSKAGASDLFIDLFTFPKEEARIGRHSIRQSIKSSVYHGEMKDPATFRPYGGHFFDAMWEGRLFDAWLRADPNNKALMRAVFGLEQIINHAVERGEPRDYATRMVMEPAL